MSVKVLVSTLVVLRLTSWSAMAAEATSATTPERGPPNDPMTMEEAAVHWDGTGELLLLPPEHKTSALALRTNFAIGATFDNTDAPGPEADAAHSAFRRCPSGIYPVRLARGGLLFTSPMGAPWRSTPRIKGLRDPDAGGSFMETVETDRCRYSLTLRLKLHDHDGWSSMPRYVSTPPAPPTGETKVLKAGETITITFPPTPAELSLWTVDLRIGPYVPPDLARTCPEASGSMWFEPQGVYISMPWSTGDLIVPGIRRNLVMRTTTLIFQTPECRLELSVRRDIRDDDGWHTSPLSVIPVGGRGG